MWWCTSSPNRGSPALPQPCLVLSGSGRGCRCAPRSASLLVEYGHATARTSTALWHAACGKRVPQGHPIPTVCLDLISLVTSSCEYYRGHIEPRTAHAFVVHVATQRGLATRRQPCHPLRAQPVAPLRERHCRRPRLPPRRCTAQAPHTTW